MSRDSLEAFAEAMRVGQRAFNRRDFESAFAGVAPDVEWHLGPWLIDGGVLHSREELIRYYRDLTQAGNWQVEALEFTAAGPGRVVVHQRGRWTGRTTMLGGVQDSFFVYEIGGDGLVARVREYASREEAVDAVS